MGDDEGSLLTGAPTKLVVVDCPQEVSDMVTGMNNGLNKPNHDGIIVGEFMPEYLGVLKGQWQHFLTFLVALTKLPTNTTNKWIICWQSAFLTPRFAKLYKQFFKRELLDFVFIESYWPWKSRFMLWIFFKINYLIAKRYGIHDRIVYGLGINQGEGDWIHGPDVWSKYFKWANDERTLRAQLGYIKKHCPGIAGIAFYNPKVNDDYWVVFDNITYEYFPD
jgi:hypothetical protein